VRGNNLPEIRLVAFGDWIHSYLSPRQSVDCNPSSRRRFFHHRRRHNHLSGRNPLQPRSTILPASPSFSNARLPTLVAFSCDERVREKESEKDRERRARNREALTGILNIGDSSQCSFFDIHPPVSSPIAPSPSTIPAWSPFPSRSFRSFHPLVNHRCPTSIHRSRRNSRATTRLSPIRALGTMRLQRESQISSASPPTLPFRGA